MRYTATNADANRDWFGWITSPNGGRVLETTARFPTGPASVWDLLDPEAELSRKVSDDRLFCGLRNYLVVATWGGGSSGPAVDIVADPFTRAELSETISTGSCFCDCAVRRPALFAYSAANVFPPPA
jgi:hypothetical protein